MTSTTMHKRLGHALAAAVAAAALLASTAAASSNGRYGPHDPWFSYATSITQATRDPWFNYAVSLTTTSPTGTVSRLATDRLAAGGGQERPVSAARSFSWSDAGIGAGVAIGSIVCLAGGALLLERRRGRLAV